MRPIATVNFSSRFDGILRRLSHRIGQKPRGINLFDSFSPSVSGYGQEIASSQADASYCRALSNYSRRGRFLLVSNTNDSRLSDPAMFLLWSGQGLASRSEEH